MLHLFNKTYLELDDTINLNYDRVVISGSNGVRVSAELERVTEGQLLRFGTTFDEVVPNFVEFITELKTHGDTSNKRINIYCDKENYKKFMAVWFKAVMPSMDASTFSEIVKFNSFNQRVLSRSPLTTSFSLTMQTAWNDTSSEDYWNNAASLSESDLGAMKALNLNYSYEFMLADYLSGSTNYQTVLQDKVCMFLERWFKEVFSDNKQTVLLNLTNHAFLTSMSIDPADVDIAAENPLSSITQFQYYNDPSIWIDGGNASVYGDIDLRDLSEAQVTGLTDTIKSVFTNYNGMTIESWMLETQSWLSYVTKGSLTKSEMDEVLDYVVATPFDTCLVPRFDFDNVNFPLILHFLNKKRLSEDLTKYRLLA